MPILITGFEPFGGYSTNPSSELAKALASEHITAVLPVEFQASTQMIRDLIDQHQPSAVVCLGLAPGRSQIELERVAINLMDARIADNDGCQPVDQPIVPGAPDGLFATLPVKTMASAISEAGVAAGLSLSAGSYCCNALMYAAIEYASRMPERTRPKCGFIHLPAAEDLNLDDQLVGLRAALRVVGAQEETYAAGEIA